MPLPRRPLRGLAQGPGHGLQVVAEGFHEVQVAPRIALDLLVTLDGELLTFLRVDGELLTELRCAGSA